ncbi:Ig-like domain-containing protein [Streptomyces sp. NRRL B-2790]|uniref:Ig-like domain-containing protein n=1 Tax=Streptomyces sp. NRRL B-2790 TaxID=1463835 RepID=UPI0035690F42
MYGGGGGGGASANVLFSGGGGGGGGSSAGPAGSTFTAGANTGNGIVTITYTLPSPVTTYLKSHPNPSKQGEPVYLSDLVCPTTDGPGVPRPTGAVTFAVDGTTVGTAKLKRSGTDSCSIAELTLKHLATGTHTITAIYSGDSTYPSNSGNPETLTQTAKKCQDDDCGKGCGNQAVSEGV